MLDTGWQLHAVAGAALVDRSAESNSADRDSKPGSAGTCARRLHLDLGEGLTFKAYEGQVQGTRTALSDYNTALAKADEAKNRFEDPGPVVPGRTRSPSPDPPTTRSPQE